MEKRSLYLSLLAAVTLFTGSFALNQWLNTGLLRAVTIESVPTLNNIDVLNAQATTLTQTLDSLSSEIDTKSAALPTISLEVAEKDATKKDAYAIASTRYLDASDVALRVVHVSTDPAVTFSSIDGLSGSFSYKGGTYPGTGGTCKTIIDNSCTIVLNFSPQGTSQVVFEAPDHSFRTIQTDLKLVVTSADKQVVSNPVKLWSQVPVPTKMILEVAAGDILTNIKQELGAPITPHTFLLFLPGKIGTVKNITITPFSSPFALLNADSCKELSDGEECRINFTFNPTKPGVYSQNINVSYFDGVETQTVSATSEDVAYGGSDKNLTASKNLLLVYNVNSPDSVAAKDYYLANRPEAASANVIGVSASDMAKVGTDYLNKEIILLDYVDQDIRQPILTWIKNHPNKNITAIVLMPGLPSRVYFGDTRDEPSVQVEIANAYAYSGICSKYTYNTNGDRGTFSTTLPPWAHDQGCNREPSSSAAGGFFTKANYPGTLALVTSIDMGSLAATKAYIDKLKAVYDAMPQPSVVISAQDTPFAGTTYYFDAIRAEGYANDRGMIAKRSVLEVNPGAKIVFVDGIAGVSGDPSHISTGKDVLGYFSWGNNGGSGPDYALNGAVTFTGKSNWYLLQTAESFNGQVNQDEGSQQGNFVKWFSKNAFGGTGYNNTPAAAVSHVHEPGEGGINDESIFSCWENGNLFIDCAWFSRQTDELAAKGDPWITK